MICKIKIDDLGIVEGAKNLKIKQNGDNARKFKVGKFKTTHRNASINTQQRRWSLPLYEACSKLDSLDERILGASTLAS